MTTAIDTPTQSNPARDDRTFLGQPRGLAYIVFTEAWERFSFYGMQALLVLYMTGHLLQPGNVENVAGFAAFRSGIEAVFGQLSLQALASQIFGLYIGMIYFMPVLGGLLGDRVLGRRKAVTAGAALMAAGHFLMAFEAAFLLALFSLILGSGLLKGNLAAQVGGLYAKNDPRRDTAFSLYCMSINVGAFIAPLVCGTLGELYGWHYGFGAAGVGMLVGIVIYLSGRNHLPVDRVADRSERVKLQPGEGRVIAALLGVLAITGLFWTGQTQVWNTYPIWIRDHVDRDLFGLSIPVTWFQSLDSLAVLVFAPVVIWFWRWQAKRRSEPGDLVKIALGCAFFAIACFLLSVGEWFAGEGKTALLWPAAFHFVCAAGYLYAAPIALALVSRAAPVSVNAMMVGAYYLALFAGGIVSGWLGRFFEAMSPASFWLMHAAIVGSGAVLILLLRPLLIRELRLDTARGE
ncbi:POT family proton-dependent oligopeptide transporter [Povalibacter uvarum]|uniref:POT family proton-dependent oligopeptide transporter n=1 Tax=Povalibacter uvarum TaxID=732238 RepID=A0A841HMA5_9GAMM|nr:peptide MFS transporter [Povalibacter uvarum]MBB6093734.1 POT family proton-dependent oligopeptide transporter [Povalibacter uvarum]